VVRSRALTAARAVLLAGPTALAFFAGGYFDEPRAWAGLGAWILVVVALIAQRRPLPRWRGGWVAIGGLAAFAAWTLLSITWAVVAGNAYHAAQIVVLYLGGLLASAMLLRSFAWQRAVEPAFAAGSLIVIGYGISERLLPGLLHFSRSFSAYGRLEQPLTYWNAMGELAALGFVLCARVAGDATRPRRLRTLAAAGGVVLGLGLYLSFSRGALFACLAGLVVLAAIAPSREQLQAIGVTLAGGALASLAGSQFRSVTSLTGYPGERERDGAIMLGLLAIVVIATALVQWRLARNGRSSPLRLPRRTPAIVSAVIFAGLALAIVAGAREKSLRPLGTGANRLVTLQSNRYDYWRVAMRAFRDEPVRGVGAGGWAVYWLRYRTINEFAQDAHSLPLQVMAELGLIGLALLAVFLAGIGLAARRAHQLAPVLSAGPIAAFVAYLAHVPLDWDWQMPAVTLVAIGLAGSLLATAESP
jgi:O-Antigen ligase